MDDQHGGEEGKDIKHVRFDPAFEVEDEERSHRILARKEEKKVGSDHNWPIRSSALVVAVTAVVAARVTDTPGLERLYVTCSIVATNSLSLLFVCTETLENKV
jgi:hypothetical protein